MVETMCTSGAVKYKAGENADSTITGDAVAMTMFINQAESMINTTARVNYTSSFASLSGSVSKLLEDVASSLAALSVIQYNMSGYTSRAEALTLLNVNHDIAAKGLRLLKDKKHTDFIDGI